VDEQLLLKLALVMACVGIIALYTITRHIELNDTTIEKITSGETSKVKLTGKVVSVRNSGKATILDISKESTVQVIIYDKVEIVPGINVTVEGRTDKSSGLITADRIEKK
jgi:aspartyl/asparaginyl-tRNA synthetase